MDKDMAVATRELTDLVRLKASVGALQPRQVMAFGAAAMAMGGGFVARQESTEVRRFLTEEGRFGSARGVTKVHEKEKMVLTACN